MDKNHVTEGLTDAEFLDYLEQEVLPTAYTPNGFRSPVCTMKHTDRERIYKLSGANISLSSKELFAVVASQVQGHINTARRIIARRVTEKLTK